MASQHANTHRSRTKGCLSCWLVIASSCILTCSTVPQSGSVESVRRCTDFSRFPASQSAPILHFFPCIHVVAVLAKIVSHRSFAFVSSLIRVYLRRGHEADVTRKQPSGANDSKIRGSASHKHCKCVSVYSSRVGDTQWATYRDRM